MTSQDADEMSQLGNAHTGSIPLSASVYGDEYRLLVFGSEDSTTRMLGLVE